MKRRRRVGVDAFATGSERIGPSNRLMPMEPASVPVRSLRPPLEICNSIMPSRRISDSGIPRFLKVDTRCWHCTEKSFDTTGDAATNCSANPHLLCTPIDYVSAGNDREKLEQKYDTFAQSARLV